MGIVIDLVVGNLQNEFSEDLLKVALSVVRVILLSLDYTLIKYTMEKKYVSPYVLGMFNGLINLVLFLIFAILDYYLFDIYHYSDYFNNFNSTELLVILGLMSTQLGLYTTLFFIIKWFSLSYIYSICIRTIWILFF